MAKTNFPATRYALARLLLTLSWWMCPSEYEWAQDRFYWLNRGLKGQANLARGRGYLDD